MHPGEAANDHGGREFDRIARYFRPLAASAAGAFALTDDAAVIEAEPGRQMVVTSDMLVAGVHFIGDEPAGLIAQKSLRVNLSDLAAKGADPRGYFLALALPAGIEDDWVEHFAESLAEDQAEFGIVLLGGDSVGTPGPLTISITAFGSLPSGSMIRRNGARPGDLVYVTGTIGDGALGLLAVQDRLDEATAAEQAMLARRYCLPQPRYRVGPLLRGVANAGLDISDGLIADLGHIAETAQVRIEIEAERIPLSTAARRVIEASPHLFDLVLGGGDDYELAITTSREKSAIIEEIAATTGIGITMIGRVEEGAGVVVRDSVGQVIKPSRAGYRHF